MKSFITCTLLQEIYNDQVKEDEMSRAYNTHREKIVAYRILVRKTRNSFLLGH
jgi:hypothetical protein